MDPSGASVSATETGTAVVESATKGFNALHSVVEAIVGLDEPPSEMA